MHFTPNKIEKNHELEKYEWQKPHQFNLTGTEKMHITQIKIKKMLVKKNTKVGKIKFIFFFFILFFIFNFKIISSENDLEGNYTEIKILDKISSKNVLVKLKNGEEYYI